MMARVSAERLYQDYKNHRGDLTELYAVVAAHFPLRKALYPGSYVDLAPSFVIPDVTYVDTDKRAKSMFQDEAAVQKIISERKRFAGNATVTFRSADYRYDFGENGEQFDFLISMFAGFVLDACTKYLRLSGLLLANNSHGDASLAALDDRYQLVAAVTSASDGRYRLTVDDLTRYLLPKRTETFTAEAVRSSGRGVAFTRTATAYVFRRCM